MSTVTPETVAPSRANLSDYAAPAIAESTFGKVGACWLPRALRTWPSDECAYAHVKSLWRNYWLTQSIAPHYWQPIDLVPIDSAVMCLLPNMMVADTVLPLAPQALAGYALHFIVGTREEDHVIQLAESLKSKPRLQAEAELKIRANAAIRAVVRRSPQDDDAAEIFYERLMTELVERWVTIAEDSRLEAHEIALEIEMQESESELEWEAGT